MKHSLAPLCVSLIVAAAAAQDAHRVPTPTRTAAWDGRPANYRVDSDLVLVNVTVTDARGRFFTGLAREDFQVLEEKTAQRLAYFSAEEAPVSVGLVLDFSGSMVSSFRELKGAVAEFLKSANPADEFCLIEFRDRAELSLAFTSDPGEIQTRVALTKPAGSTALLDAVDLGLRQMKKARNARRILLIVSDGGDNHSRFRAREVETLARESDVEIYVIDLPGQSSSQKQLELLEGPALLTELAEEAGGRSYQIGFDSELPAVAEKIGRELRHQYVLGYVPTNQNRDGRYRHIQVKVTRRPGQPRLSAYWRHGYYARAAY